MCSLCESQIFVALKRKRSIILSDSDGKRQVKGQAPVWLGKSCVD